MRRFLIIMASGFISMILVLAAMQFTCWFLNRMYGMQLHGPLYHVTWLAK